MLSDSELSAVLKRYVAVEDEVLSKIADDLRNLPGLDTQRDLTKDKVLEKIEVHRQAEALVETAVAHYREKLYFVARSLAEEDLQTDIITTAHVRRAQQALSRRGGKYTWGDGLLAVGALMSGAGVSHIVDLFVRTKTPPNPTLIIAALVGALLLGMGIFDKAKS